MKKGKNFFLQRKKQRTFFGAVADLTIKSILVLFCEKGLIAFAAQPSWFTPPPPHATIERPPMDVHDLDSQEDITVTGHRAPIQHDPHDAETRDAQPSRSDAAGPTQRITPSRDCSPAYQTVAGQPASGMDMMSMGSAGCN